MAVKKTATTAEYTPATTKLGGRAWRGGGGQKKHHQSGNMKMLDKPAGTTQLTMYSRKGKASRKIQRYRWKQLENVLWWGSTYHPPVSEAHTPCRSIWSAWEPMSTSKLNQKLKCFLQDCSSAAAVRATVFCVYDGTSIGDGRSTEPVSSRTIVPNLGYVHLSWG